MNNFAFMSGGGKLDRHGRQRAPSESSGGSDPYYLTPRTQKQADFIDLLLTLISCVVYVIDTYLEEEPGEKLVKEWLWVVELVISTSLLLLYVVRLVSSIQHGRNLIEFVLAPSSLLDLFTSLPVLIAVLLFEESSRSIRIFRILRVLRTFSTNSDLQTQPIAQQVSTIALTISAIVFISACAFPLLENSSIAGGFPYSDFPFHDSLYYVIITISTVGYGDFSPVTTQGRMAACLMVVITFIILPMQSAKLIEAITARDPFGGSFRGSVKRPHLLIIGRVSAATLRHFKEALLVSGYHQPMRMSLPSALRSLFSMAAEDGGQSSAAVYAWLHSSDRWGGARLKTEPWELQIVILSSSPPDDHVRRILSAQQSPRRLHWVRGTALSHHDLERVDLRHAIAAIVLADERLPASAFSPHPAAVHDDDRSGGDPTWEPDTRSVLDALALCYRSPHLPCIVQLGQHTQAGHLRLLGTSCVLESMPLRQMVLATSCHCPGATSLLNNLLQPAHAHEVLSQVDPRTPLSDWQREYLIGVRQQLQRLPVPPALAGATPLTAALRAFSEAGVLILARSTGDPTDGKAPQFLLSTTEPLELGEALFVLRDVATPAQLDERVAASISLSSLSIRSAFGLAAAQGVGRICSIFQPYRSGESPYLAAVSHASPGGDGGDSPRESRYHPLPAGPTAPAPVPTGAHPPYLFSGISSFSSSAAQSERSEEAEGRGGEASTVAQAPRGPAAVSSKGRVPSRRLLLVDSKSGKGSVSAGSSAWDAERRTVPVVHEGDEASPAWENVYDALLAEEAAEEKRRLEALIRARRGRGAFHTSTKLLHTDSVPRTDASVHGAHANNGSSDASAGPDKPCSAQGASGGTAGAAAGGGAAGPGGAAVAEGVGAREGPLLAPAPHGRCAEATGSAQEGGVSAVVSAAPAALGGMAGRSEGGASPAAPGTLPRGLASLVQGVECDPLPVPSSGAPGGGDEVGSESRARGGGRPGGGGGAGGSGSLIPSSLSTNAAVDAVLLAGVRAAGGSPSQFRPRPTPLPPSAAAVGEASSAGSASGGSAAPCWEKLSVSSSYGTDNPLGSMEDARQDALAAAAAAFASDLVPPPVTEHAAAAPTLVAVPPAPVTPPLRAHRTLPKLVRSLSPDVSRRATLASSLSSSAGPRRGSSGPEDSLWSLPQRANSSASLPPADEAEPQLPPPPAEGLEGHVLLCGLPLYLGSLRDFVAPLRCKSRFPDVESCPAVLLLQPTHPPLYAWRGALGLPKVYYMPGSSTDMGDMLRAGIDSAAYVVMPRIGIRREDRGHDYNVYEDAATILTCREIESSEELYALPIAEVAHTSNMDFLMPHNRADVDEASGTAGLGPHAESMYGSPLLSPYYAAGRVLSPTFLSSVMCSLLRLPELPDLLEDLLVGSSGGGCLLQWCLPTCMHHSTYGDLVEHLAVQHSAMTLGLLRAGLDTSAPLPFVLTNPPSATQLHTDDHVFVVARRENEPASEDDEPDAPSLSPAAIPTKTAFHHGHHAHVLRTMLSMPILPNLPPPSTPPPHNHPPATPHTAGSLARAAPLGTPSVAAQAEAEKLYAAQAGAGLSPRRLEMY